MKYTPPGFKTGILTLIIGIALLVMLYKKDKQTNKVLLERAKEKERIKNGLPAVNTDNQPKKPAVIKSKGAPAGKAEEKPAPAKKEEKPSSVQEAAAQAADKPVEEMSSAEYLAAVETKQIKKQPNGKKKSGGKKKKK